MHLQQNKKSGLILASLLLCMSFLTVAQQNINNIKVTITFDAAPSTYTVTKAPLKYNKTFAFSFQVDDGTIDITNKVLPLFNNLFYTDGCGNDIHFTASSSVYCFQNNGENGPDMHDPLDPSFDNKYLTWNDITSLYNDNYGIYDHGVNGNPSTYYPFMNYSIKRNRSFLRRKLFGLLQGANSSNVFVSPDQLVEWTQPAFDNGFSLALNKKDGGPFDLFGGDVNNSNWTSYQYLKRREAHRVIPVQEYVDTLFLQSVGGANFWGSLFTHLIPDVDTGAHYPKDVFNTDFSKIASVYGKGALDNIIIATDEEIYDYLSVRDNITLNESLVGNVLEITFSGNVPDNFRYYAMSLVATADVGISSIVVSGADGFSQNTATGLVNFKWDDRLIPDPETIADSYTSIAESSNDKWDAWIAMDYVYTLPLGDKKVELANRLCSLSDISYEDGFCDITIDTIVKITTGDSILCLGDTATLTATPGMQVYEWSTSQGESVIKVSPMETTKYWVRGRYNGVDSYDTITVVVNPVPNIVSHSPTTITHIEGINDTLWVSAQDATLTYLWDTGGTDSTLLVDPIFSTDYYVDVINEFECSTRQDFSVIVEKTFDFTYDSVCLGGTTHFENKSTYPDSVILVSWDLNSDGVFDDAVGNTVDYEFTEYGNHLVGMRSTLYPTGLEVAFNVVPVGDNPVPDFIVTNNCLPNSTNFEDISTVVVGETNKWEWDFGDGGTDVGSFVSHTYFTPDAYIVKLKVVSTIGCADSIDKIIDIGESADFTMIDINGNELFANDTSWISKNDSLYVSIQNASAFDSIIWNNSVNSPVYYVKNEGTFSVDVFSGPCFKTRERILAFRNGGVEPTTNKIMSLFTPNGDGYNDTWVVNDPAITSPFKVSVYNRYGNLVYQSDNYQNDWLGDYKDTNLPQATYYYLIEDAAGQIFKGPITIIR
jgi:gliding motility-associated-like protein